MRLPSMPFAPAFSNLWNIIFNFFITFLSIRKFYPSNVDTYIEIEAIKAYLLVKIY